MHEVASCHGCHQLGVLPVADMIRPFVEVTGTLFDAEIVASVKQAYPLPTELDALIASDSLLHTSALERAGVSPAAPDPLSYVYYQFELDPLSLPRVAAELGVTAEELRAQLPLLEGRVRGLGEPAASIPRGILEEAYVQNWCILHAESRNRPVLCP